jgi:hypothetical protein
MAGGVVSLSSPFPFTNRTFSSRLGTAASVRQTRLISPDLPGPTTACSLHLPSHTHCYRLPSHAGTTPAVRQAKHIFVDLPKLSMLSHFARFLLCFGACRHHPCGAPDQAHLSGPTKAVGRTAVLHRCHLAAGRLDLQLRPGTLAAFFCSDFPVGTCWHALPA